MLDLFRYFQKPSTQRTNKFYVKRSRLYCRPKYINFIYEFCWYTNLYQFVAKISGIRRMFVSRFFSNRFFSFFVCLFFLGFGFSFDFYLVTTQCGIRGAFHSLCLLLLYTTVDVPFRLRWCRWWGYERERRIGFLSRRHGPQSRARSRIPPPQFPRRKQPRFPSTGTECIALLFARTRAHIPRKWRPCTLRHTPPWFRWR